METIKLNKSALHQVVTANPDTKSEVHIMMSILMTNRKRPSVKMVIGMVSKTKIGFTIALSKPNTSATIIAVYVLLTVTFGSNHEANKTAMAVINILIMMRCIFSFY